MYDCLGSCFGSVGIMISLFQIQVHLSKWNHVVLALQFQSGLFISQSWLWICRNFVFDALI